MSAPVTITLHELMRRLGITSPELIALLELEPKYTVSHRPKSRGGVRIICAPDPALKRIQRLILDRILVHLPVSRRVFGGMRGRNHIHHACVHQRASNAFVVDLADAFTHGTPARVRQAFQGLLFSPKAVDMIVLLTTDPSFGLPQGAPTSNALFNLVCAELDRVATAYARSRSLRYTRYVDELVFSSVGQISPEMREEILCLIRDLNFRMNPHKIRFFDRRHGAMRVTGMSLPGNGARVRLSRRRREDVRSFFHRAEIDPVISRAMVEGKMSEIRQVYGRYVPERILRAYRKAVDATQSRFDS